MEEQEKMNSMGMSPGDEQNAAPAPGGEVPENQTEGTPRGAYPQPPNSGYPSQFGYGQPGQQYGYNPQFGYQQPFAQQGGYRPAAPGYPQQGAAPYGYQQPGTGAGQYNYKVGYNQNAGYSGAGPGQYDFRAASQQAGNKPQQAAPNAQQGQYPYAGGGYQQYGYGQPQAGAGYGYQQQYPYGQPNQQYGYGQQYGYNQPYPQQQAPKYPNIQRAKMANPPVTENGEAVIKVNPPKDDTRTTAAVDGDIVREELSPDGKKKIVVRRVVNNQGGETPPQGAQQQNVPSKFIQNQIKNELGEDAFKGANQPVVVYKSKMKKKPDKEGVYEPSLRDMLLGPPKKEVTDRDPDPFEWKCPDCGTINPDTVGTCMCGCTQRRAKAIAAGRIPKDVPTNKPKQEAPAAPAAQQRQPQPQQLPRQAQEEALFNSFMSTPDPQGQQGFMPQPGQQFAEPAEKPEQPEQPARQGRDDGRGDPGRDRRVYARARSGMAPEVGFVEERQERDLSLR